MSTWRRERSPVASEQDKALYWAGKAADVHHNMLDTVQASAGKWQAAIAAFLGAYATVGFVVGRPRSPTFRRRDGNTSSWPCWDWLPPSPWSPWLRQPGCRGVSQSGAGLPPYWTPDGSERARRSQTVTPTSPKGRSWLPQLPVVLAVSGSFGILAYGLTASAPALTALLTTHSASYCGTLQTNSDGTVSLLLSNGKQVRAKGGTITIVTSCGGS